MPASGPLCSKAAALEGSGAPWPLCSGAPRQRWRSAAAVLQRRAASAAAGLQDAVGAKLRRYPPDKHPTVGFVAFAVGALGRLSPEARGLLGSMSRDSADTRRAYQAVSFLAQQRLADVLRASEPRLQ